MHAIALTHHCLLNIETKRSLIQVYGRKSFFRITVGVALLFRLTACMRGTMDLEELIHIGQNFYYDQPIITLVCVAVLLILLCLRPKQFLKLMIALLILGAVFYILYLIGEATFTGVTQKGKIVNKVP